jgi:Fe-S cluster assembly protein SufD
MVSLGSIAAQHDPRAARVAALAARPEGAPWLGLLRRTAWEQFAALGFPSPRSEAWRSTDVSPIARTSFAAAGVATVREAELDGIAVPGLAGPRLVFVNGHWVPELSRLDGLPADMHIGGLAAALAGGAGAGLEAHLAQLADPAAASFTALNTACFEDGALIRVPRGAVVSEPIQLLFLGAPAGPGREPFEFHPRVLVVAEERAQASVVEIHAGRGTYLTNAVTEIALGTGAILAHTRVQRDAASAYHIARVSARLQRDARFTSHAVSLGAALARCEVEVQLAGEGAECALYGLYVAGGSQHADNRTDVEHASPHCTSNQLYKGVLGGHAHGVFNGKVLVAKDAQKTDAHQTNRNLLLSDTALADTKPQLEIYADDVRCTHGATIGQLDAMAVFYLQSRGIGAAAAREMLTHAFARDTLTHCEPAGLREALAAWVAAQVSAVSAPGRAAA